MIKLPRFLPFYCLFCVFCFLGCTSSDDSSFMEDKANLLTREEQEHLILYNNALLKDFDIHFRLIILENKSEDINGLAAELFGNLGEQTRGKKGLLFLVDPKGQQVRIEVGYDLEFVYPDVFVGYLERAQMVPFFQAGKIGSGIEATTELLIVRVQRAISGHEFDPDLELGGLDNFSGGGGARVQVDIDSKTVNKKTYENKSDFKPQNSPKLSLEMYKRILRSKIKDPDLPIFTPKTRTFFAKWVVTDAQQNNELRGLEEDVVERVIIDADYAVVRFPLNKRTAAPYFFQKSEEGWMLDFWTMSQVIRMNHKNMWMIKRTDHPYMFGFSDWKFDKNGFPISEN